eukprot:COSAG02_NODE_1443_length_12584_cov_2.587425_5_plen_66_part_00
MESQAQLLLLSLFGTQTIFNADVSVSSLKLLCMVRLVPTRMHQRPKLSCRRWWHARGSNWALQSA